MDKIEFRVLIKHCFLMEKNTVQTKAWLDKCYNTSAPPNSTIKYWFAEFRRDRTSTTDAPRSGRPNEAVTPENIKKVTDLVMNDRKMKLSEIANIIGISKERVGHIMHEHLHMRKLCARWVPRFLTIDQKAKRIRLSTQNLDMIRRNKKEFLRRFVTMDETWIHHYTPESNRQSAEWLFPGESRVKRPKTQQSAGKVLASIFWDAHGIIFIDYLQHGRTINRQYYCALLDRLDDEIKLKRPHLAKKKILFHQDNAPAHSARDTTEKLKQLRYEVVEHPPYSPDLAPSDYFLFPRLKNWLAGKRFHSNDEVEAETNAYFEGLDGDHYKMGIEMLEDRYIKCITLDGDYVEE